MDLAGLRSFVREVQFNVHGVAAVVTVPDGTPVATRIIWIMPVTEPTTDLRREPRRMLAVRRDEVPELPKGTTVEVTEHLLEEPTLWSVDGMADVLPDQHRCYVVPVAVTA